MLVKRKPGPLSRSKVNHDYSWRPGGAPSARPKPPGRPWHSPRQLKVCLICLRQFSQEELCSEDEDEDDDDDQNAFPPRDPLSNDLEEVPLPEVPPRPPRRNLYLQFLTFLSRHLKVNTRRFISSAERNQLEPPFCPDCGGAIRHLLKINRELVQNRLFLTWRLGQLSERINQSKTKLGGKLHQTLLKNLSTQLRVVGGYQVDLLRKQVRLQATSKTKEQVPKVKLNRNGILQAVKARWKWKTGFEQMKQYLQSLIVVFALAVPPKEVPPPSEPPKKLGIGPRSKMMKRVTFKEGEEPLKENLPPTVGIKMERGSEIKVKREPGGLGDGGDQDADYSPPASPLASPVGGDDGGDDDDQGNNEEENNAGDSDWSAGAASGNDSDADFSVHPTTERRWNLRRRSTRSKNADNDADSDPEYTPGNLPPLRRKNPEDSSIPKPFSCNLCSQRFSLDRGLKRHLHHAHSFIIPYTCPKCPTLRFRLKKQLDHHHRTVHSKYTGTPGSQLPFMGRPTPCTVCSVIFPSKIKMMIHRKTTHKQLTKLLTCTICQKQVRGQVRMDFHMQTHNRPDKPHRCDLCPRSFCTEEGLKCHQKLHQDNPNWVPFTRNKKAERERSSNRPPREGVYPCDIPGCSKIFYKHSNLLVHKSLHSTQFSCKLCQFNCLQIREFRHHLQEKHEDTENLLHFCPHCPQAFTQDQTFDLHKKVAHPTKKMLNCDVDTCQKEFEELSELRTHLITDHLPEGVEETKENLKFTDLYTAKPDSDAPEVSSETNETPRLYTCARCNWSFTRKILYSLHLLLHTPRDSRKLYQCELCPKAFSVVDSLQTHYNTVHGPRIKPYLCLICGTRFHRKESFVPHMRIHKDREETRGTNGEKKTFDCPDCGKSFGDSVNLKKHRRLAHPLEKYSKKCPTCGESFGGKLKLLEHEVEVHGKEKPFKCEVEGCGKSYLQMTGLKEHRVVHSEPQLQCPLCPKRFKRRHNLEDHILVHKQEKNHFCEYCGKAFVKKSSLSLHLDIHRGIKKYKCEFEGCGKEFCRKFARDCHLRVHTKERPFSCEYCGRSFAQYSAFSTHRKMHLRLNSDKVERRPFRRSKGVGKKIRQEEEVTSAGILSEAMKMAFEGIEGELLEANQEGGGTEVIAEAKVQAVEGMEEPKEEEEEEIGGDQEEEMEEKVKRKRKKKVYKKEYSCGFCGKVFHREDYYSRHVNKHMSEAGGDNVQSGGMSTPTPQGNSQSSFQEETSRGGGGLGQFATLGSNVPMPILERQDYHQQNQEEPPAPPVSQEAPPVKKRGRGRPSLKNSAVELPGSRLARIVEDVLETATKRPVQQVQYSQPQIPPQVQSPHSLVQSPSPHSQHQNHSLHSTPSVSPSPNHLQAHQPITIPSTSTNNLAQHLNFPSGLSPFLFQNPYLIPRSSAENATQSQTDPMFATFPHRQPQQPQQQQYHPPQVTSALTTQVNYPQQQYHQPRGSGLPQDLSKTNFQLFYTTQNQNHRQ